MPRRDNMSILQGALSGVDQSSWPLTQLLGWAPGMYSCTCLDCGLPYTGDKRSFMCYPCASTADKRKAELDAGAGI